MKKEPCPFYIGELLKIDTCVDDKIRDPNCVVMKSVNQISPFQASCDRNLTALRDDLATDLFELEEEYYSSSYK